MAEIGSANSGQDIPASFPGTAKESFNLSTAWSDVCMLSLPGRLVKELRAVGRVGFALEVGLTERYELPKDSSGNENFEQSMKRTVYLLGVCALTRTKNSSVN